MFITANNHTSEGLRKYTRNPLVLSVQFKKQKGKKKGYYTYKNGNGEHVKCGGLTTYLKKEFYKDFKQPKRRYSSKNKGGCQKKASTRGLGKRVDRELATFITTNGDNKRKRKRPLHPLTEQIKRHWDSKGLTPVCSQLPVVIPEIGRVTQADIILQDRNGDLWMHEVKTGCVGVGVVKGTFSAPYDKTPCTKGNQWDLQRQFTETALIDQGLPLKGSRVLHAYEHKKKGAIALEREKVFKSYL